MTERKLSVADAALRNRITELSVHIPCGRLRGPVPPTGKWGQYLQGRWQSCPDEDSPEKWVRWDVSQALDLCVICFKATAGGPTRWSWLACYDCLAVNAAIGSPFALGRHSLMNGISVRVGAPGEREQIARLVAFARGDDQLREWRQQEYSRLASSFDPLADIPLRVWQHEWAPSPSASWDAFSRLTGLKLP